MSGGYTRFGSHALLEPASIGAAPMVYEQHHTTETTPDSNAVDCSDRLTPGKSRNRTSGVLALHMYDKGVYQALPTIERSGCRKTGVMLSPRFVWRIGLLLVVISAV